MRLLFLYFIQGGALVRHVRDEGAQLRDRVEVHHRWHRFPDLVQRFPLLLKLSEVPLVL